MQHACMCMGAHSCDCLHAQDLVEKHIQRAKWNVSDGSPDVGILLLGDSADRNLIYDFCVSAGHEARMHVPSLLLPLLSFGVRASLLPAEPGHGKPPCLLPRQGAPLCSSLR